MNLLNQTGFLTVAGTKHSAQLRETGRLLPTSQPTYNRRDGTITMKTFHCICDSQPILFFDSTTCTTCGRLTGFCPDQLQLKSFDLGSEEGIWLQADNHQNQYRPCNNYTTHQVCNWMIPAADPDPFCTACRLNEIIPDLSIADNLTYWGRLEKAKRQTLYTLLALGLPLQPPTAIDDTLYLRFRFMADKTPVSEFTQPLQNQEPIATGHQQGEITINIAEADAIARTRAQVQLDERYRTLLGHFRHEIGHYYWSMLVAPDPEQRQAFRNIFGDEQQNYAAAQQNHYTNSPTAGWETAYISSYATMHPWEDWAESWTHYLHMVDTLETAASFGLTTNGAAPFTLQLQPNQPLPPAAVLFEQWIQLSVVLNSLNRSMGFQDAYPFVLHEPIRQKLAWVHQILHISRQSI